MREEKVEALAIEEMEGGKRVGVALLVLLVAVACFADQSSARSHPGLDFLARVMNKETNAATAKCDLCICLPKWPPICFCADQFDCCPSWCKNCEEVDGKYFCQDRNPDQCKMDSSPDTNQMIKLPHGHE
uniref:Bowman-Birk serine protease inhibitors family domain-containing protein n=1 Tax=Ananas comosus var. bracteatus TaxID=296719 RepID=A0A6V7QL29_ANACO|nr:unnamed protein product [Ananas comosus var. bracteatus]